MGSSWLCKLIGGLAGLDAVRVGGCKVNLQIQIGSYKKYGRKRLAERSKPRNLGRLWNLFSVYRCPLA